MVRSRSSRSRDSVADVWGPRTPHESSAWPVRVDEHTTEEPERWVQSACVLCSNGCALDIGVRDGRIVGVRGRDVDRINKGRLGPKGLNGWQANNSPDRLTTPLVRRNGGLRPCSWDEAMDTLVSRSREVIDRYGRGAYAFYTSGQLMLEEYYTLAVIARAGISTPHLDGNTRLCTATAAMALMESFGSDGDPGSYADLDLCDAIFHMGHNIASTQTVLWSRILDRRASHDRPALVVVDPRRTATAAEADVHLAPRLATNVPLLNGILHVLIDRGWMDESFVADHTNGFDQLQRIVSQWPPDRVARVCDIDVGRLMAAAEILGTAPRLVSTVLQGVYQSWQATAAAVQVNNLHLLRGMIGKPGCTVFQMNGQPTAQNTRECGANGELAAFRNWNNQAHVADLARVWNVEPAKIPSYAPPTHAMQIFRYAEEGSIRMLWISATNPAVSLPELHRIRRVLTKHDVFVVLSDAFLTETAECADLVLPAALWGEKTGTFTNADRTVHISHKAVDPPGEARSDLDILLDFAERMQFEDKAGAPLVKWTDPESTFEAWKECSRGEPCDYTGLSYDRLAGGSGIQWPCNDEHPDGKERLYTDGVFNTGYDRAEIFGHDFVTGAEVTPAQYREMHPAGRAFIKPAEYVAPPEEPDEKYPLWLSTGRLVHHWHTRTKTARAPELQRAAKDPFVEISADDAARFGVADGDLVEVASRRASIQVPARITDIKRGHLFTPFHYGYWDVGDGDRRRAANEITLTAWDPVSKQPYFKFAAVRIHKVGRT
jgi:anaerobic selenocysteine-containing dehydrogenase